MYHLKMYKVTIGEFPTEVISFMLAGQNDLVVTAFVSDRVNYGPDGCFARVDMQESSFTLYANKVRGRLCVDMIEDDIIDMSHVEEEANKVIMGHTNK